MKRSKNPDRRRRILPQLNPLDEGGSALLEVMVSAMMIAIVAVGVLGAVDASTRSTSEERHRARADGLAQEDLARMRSMRISDLSNFNDSRTVSKDGTPYTIASRAEFASDASGTGSCDSGTAAADYVLITSTVTWPSLGTRPPVSARSIVSPPNGSVSANSGSLAVRIEDASNTGIPSVGISGTGPDTFNGSTGANGCIVFGNLPAGNYSLAVSGTALVDRNGNPPLPESTSVVAESTNTLVLQYDNPGSIPVTFGTRIGGSLVASTADSVVVFNTGMTIPKKFGTVGTPVSELTAGGLFPFLSPYAVYAGTCDGNNPNPTGEDDPPAAAAIATVVVPAGNGAPAVIEIPALHLTVWSGVDSSNPGAPVQGARVRVADQNCDDAAGAPIQRTFATNASGGLADPGLPYGTYDVCADDGVKRTTLTSVAVQDLSVGATLNLYLGGATAVTGICP
ncbi:MAG: hypothetical protein EXQ70_10735 [Solirubrobacterales bacterium]|nr:hypothetical protein [Solirubrobacterales bacterium]